MHYTITIFPGMHSAISCLSTPLHLWRGGGSLSSPNLSLRRYSQTLLGSLVSWQALSGPNLALEACPDAMLIMHRA